MPLREMIHEFCKVQTYWGSLKEKKNTNESQDRSSEKSTELLIKPKDFDSISKIFFKNSDVTYKNDKTSYAELFRNCIEEVHLINSGLNRLCKCPFCEHLVYKISEKPDFKIEYFTSLELPENQSIYEFVEKIKHNFIDTILISADMNKFKDIIRGEYFKMFMILKLYTNNDYEKMPIRYNDYLVYHMKPLKRKDYIAELENLKFEDPKNEFHSFFLYSLILVYGGRNKSITILKNNNKWNFIEDDDTSEERIYKNIFDALFSVQCYDNITDIFLFYLKQARLDNKNQNAGQGTQPLRCDNPEDMMNCFINSAIQSIFNLPSFKTDICKWKPKNNIEWANEFIKIVKTELSESIQGKKSCNLSIFRKKFSESDCNLNKLEKGKANSLEFLDLLQKKIHENSYCTPNEKCPSCKNFWIKGFIVSNRQKEVNSYSLTQTIDKIGIKYNDNILTIYGKIINRFDIPNPPWALIYKIQVTSGNDEKKKTEMLEYFLENNQCIDYVNNGKSYHYELKSIILFKNEHYKTLLFSRTYNLWMLVNDSDLEPLYLKLEDFELITKGYFPEGFIYYRGVPMKSIKDYISNLFLSICSTQALIRVCAKTDTNNKDIKDIFSLLVKFDKAIIEKTQLPEIPLQCVNSFKKKGEIRFLDDIFNSFLSIFHCNAKNCLKCKCIACKIFCCQIVVNRDGNEKIIRKLGVSVIEENVTLQYNVVKKGFDYQVFFNNLSEADNLKLETTPPLLAIDLKANLEDSKLFLYENEILFTNNPSEVYTIHSIIFSMPSNYDSLAYIKISGNWIIYENGLIASNPMTLQEIINKGYTPNIAFYEKQSFKYISKSLEIMSSLTKFKNAFLKYTRINEKWFTIMKTLLRNECKLKNSKKIWEFKESFNEKAVEKICDNALKNYNIENTIKLIFYRIHIGSKCIDYSCPVCRIFLIKGFCRRSDDNKTYPIFSLMLLNHLVPGVDQSISGNYLTYSYENRLVPIIYKLIQIPQILYYICIYYLTDNDKQSEVLATCKNCLKDKIILDCTEDNKLRIYMLKCVVFSIKNELDINCLAVRNQNVWEISGSNKTCTTTPEILDIIKETYRREDFFPSELFYELC
ncbi:hypothetical protein SteCoe_18089 [Stentor coeruleus]|uniref:Peptidase C19 ubiquitin carboxyl-terminal hydrolase domain-containing protein n=1 Tax=Stentor coeruleus TaxID=5963 RepID=A0A1R2BXC9_9CILI|nr:hypothetical protein SteCoe_18089 [Stentor coeruleus]